MKTGVATATFRRSDTRVRVRAGGTVMGEDNYIDDLKRTGLLREVKAIPWAPENKARPTETDGATEPSSASPAVRVSRQTTVSVSESGTPKKKRLVKSDLLL